MGGILLLESFVKVFPEIDTTTAGLTGLTKSQQNHRTTIEGTLSGLARVSCITNKTKVYLSPPTMLAASLELSHASGLATSSVDERPYS